MAVMIKHINASLPPPSAINPALPEAVERVILKALTKSPEDRFATAAEMVNAVQAASPEVTVATPSAEPRFQKEEPQPSAIAQPILRNQTLRRRWGYIIGGLMLVISTLGIATIFGKPAIISPTSPPSTATTPPVTVTLIKTSLPRPSLTHPLATATQTPTLPPTLTFITPPTLASPTLEPLAFQSVSLGNIANALLTDDYAAPPSTRGVFGGIPFNLDGQVFKSQASPSPYNSYPTDVTLEVEQSRVERVYILATTGNAFTRWQGETVGLIILVFDSASPITVELVLGANLREWHAAENVVSSASGVREVWQGAIVGYPNLAGTLDMLTIEVPTDRHDAILTQIEIHDVSESTVGSQDPGLNIIGVTVAHR